MFLYLFCSADPNSMKGIEKKTKVNGPGRQKLEQGMHSWQWARHAWLYSDLLRALTTITITIYFIHPSGKLKLLFSRENVWEINRYTRKVRRTVWNLTNNRCQGRFLKCGDFMRRKVYLLVLKRAAATLGSLSQSGTQTPSAGLRHLSFNHCRI